jgi:hypothetical protein
VHQRGLIIGFRFSQAESESSIRSQAVRRWRSSPWLSIFQDRIPMTLLHDRFWRSLSRFSVFLMVVGIVLTNLGCSGEESISKAPPDASPKSESKSALPKRAVVVPRTDPAKK